MPTPTLACGYGDGIAANTVYAIPVGPYRLLSSGAITFSTTVDGSFSALSGATTEPGVLVSGGFVQAVAPRTYVLKKINTLLRTYAGVASKSNPLSFWRFGEQSGSTLYDSFGTNNLTAGSGVTLAATGPLGDSSFAITLDGTSNGVGSRVGPNTWSGGTALSFEAWIYNPAFAVAHEMIISLGGQGIYMSVVDSKLIMSIHLGTQFTNTALPAKAFVANTWYHVAVTWVSADYIRLYVNGVEIAGDNPTVRTGTLTSSPNIYIGAFNGSSLFWSGTLADVALYMRKLSATEIFEHYQAKSAA